MALGEGAKRIMISVQIGATINDRIRMCLWQASEFIEFDVSQLLF